MGQIIKEYKKKVLPKKTIYEEDLERALFWKGNLERTEQDFLYGDPHFPIRKGFYLVEAIKDDNEMQNLLARNDLKKSIEKYLTIRL